MFHAQLFRLLGLVQLVSPLQGICFGLLVLMQLLSPLVALVSWSAKSSLMCWRLVNLKNIKVLFRKILQMRFKPRTPVAPDLEGPAASAPILGCPCADCLNGLPLRDPEQPSLEDQYVIDLHREYLAEHPGLLARLPEPEEEPQEPRQPQCPCCFYTLSETLPSGPGGDVWHTPGWRYTAREGWRWCHGDAPHRVHAEPVWSLCGSSAPEGPRCACCYYSESRSSLEPGWRKDNNGAWSWNACGAPHEHLLDDDAWDHAQSMFVVEEYALSPWGSWWS